jgi:hypothetical protein
MVVYSYCFILEVNEIIDEYNVMYYIKLMQEKLDDTKGEIRSRKSKDIQYNGQRKKEKQ